MNSEFAHWMAFTHDLIPRAEGIQHNWVTEEKMKLVIKFHHENKITIEDFFSLSDAVLSKEYEMTDLQINDINKIKENIPNYAFIAEKIINNGIDIIPVTSPDYSRALKDNLKTKTPLVIYTKGNKKILQEQSVAVVGSRNASPISMQFTDNIVKQFSAEFKVIVSGFAKGVDKQALDSALKYKGQSIIVLPQGILTFESGFKQYYKQIIDGDVLVLSTFHPNAGWGTDLAMARNNIIYGLANDIYVAEAKPSINKAGVETKGGTFSGVVNGLKRGRKIYVRKPELSESNDNNLLISQGAIPVDMFGNVIDDGGEGKVVFEQGSLF